MLPSQAGRVSTIWTVLGIAPTNDIPTIRRAYAEKLRTIDQEKDADNFMALRNAFTTALRFAGQPASNARPPALPEIPRPPADPEQDQDSARITAEQQNFSIAEAAGNFAAANAAYNHLRALGAGGGPGFVSPLTIRLATIAAGAADLSGPEVDRLLRDIGLDAMALDRAKNLSGMAALTDLLNARTAAEAWLEAIQKRAAASRWTKANRRDRYGYQAALFITGRRNYRLAAYAPTIQRELARFDKHRRFIGNRLDAARLDSARARKQNIPEKYIRKFVPFAVLLIAAALALMRAYFDPSPN